MRRVTSVGLGLAMAVAVQPATAQTFPTDDPVIQRMWQLGMEESQAGRLAQALLDSIGGRLTGTPQLAGGHEWLVSMYSQWGITARNEQYGTWNGWRRGITHIDLISPRVRSLEGTMMGWSAGTQGRVEGAVVLFPDVSTPQEFEAWLPQARGNFVAMDFAQPTCRPDREWEEYGAPAPGGRGGRGGAFGGRAGGAGGPDTLSSFGRMQWQRARARDAWSGRLRGAAGAAGNASTSPLGAMVAGLRLRLEEAGAAGVLHSNWSNDYGVNKVFTTNTTRIPSLDLSCEDYGLVVRLARNNQSPRLRVEAEAEFLGEVPTFNTIAEIRGSELPTEYVLLSAHFDSFDSSSGATDNGTGTITMLEAMRILKQAYPNPRRTILAGHWASEEQGLNGSRAWAHDHPEVVEGIQAVFNQDNGTGRVVNISMGGLLAAGQHFGNWMAKIPTEISGFINLGIPGSPAGGGSDHASFACAGAPAFGLGALNWGYGTYTWHTNRDTFDKVVLDDLKNNATLTAMLAYLASEDPQRIARDRRVMPTGRGGQPQPWPQCQDGARRAGG